MRKTKTNQRVINKFSETVLRSRKGTFRQTKLAPDFSGYIEYRRYDGTRKYLLRIVNGKSVRRYNISALTGNTRQQVQSLHTNNLICTEICEPAYNENCWQDEEGMQQCTTMVFNF